MMEPLDRRTAAAALPHGGIPLTAQPAVARTLADLLLSSAADRPEKEAFVSSQERLSYTQLVQRAWSVACSLAALGVQPRQHVGLMMKNSPEFIVTLFAISMLGAVAVPINARYRSSELRFLIRDADLVVILTTDRTDQYVDFTRVLTQALSDLAQAPNPYDLKIEGAPALRTVVVFGRTSKAGMLDEASFQALATSADAARVGRWCDSVGVRDPAAIIYTSGTASTPRGAILSHEALVRAWMMVGRRWGIGADDRIWNPCPLFHTAALGPLIFTIGHGATYLTDHYFEPQRALELLAAERATMLYPVYPPITQGLLGHPEFARTDLSTVKVWLNLAAPDRLRQLAEAIPHASLISTYGSPEGGPVTMHDPKDEFEIRMSTCGHALPGVEVRITDPKTGVELPLETVGEIAYRGYNTCSGYYKDAEKDATTIDAQGWVHSGDLGMLDQKGRLFLHGRCSETLKVGGENVAPAEVEDFLGTHQAVRRVRVVGIPDGRLSEVVAAFVELHAGAQVSEEELLAYCRDQIASFKVPRLIRFVTTWPMPSERAQRAILRDWLARELE